MPGAYSSSLAFCFDTCAMLRLLVDLGLGFRASAEHDRTCKERTKPDVSRPAEAFLLAASFT